MRLHLQASASSFPKALHSPRAPAELGESFAPSEELFPNEKLDENKALEVLGIAKA